MKKTFLTILLVVALMFSMIMPVLSAFTQAFNLDDFKITPGADIAIAADPDNPEQLYSGKAIWGDERDNDGDTHFTVLEFEVPENGKYALWFLVWALNEIANSLFLSLDGGEPFTFDFMEAIEPDPDFEYYNLWYWMWLNNRQEIMDEHDVGFDGFNAYMTGQKKYLDLTAGAHTLKLITREPYAKYAGLIITDDLNYDPNKDSALQVGKVDPKTVYPLPTEPEPEPEPVIDETAMGGGETADAEIAAVIAAPAPPPPVSAAQTGNMTIIFLMIFAAGAFTLAKRFVKVK